ncbi:MAG: PleD family two-component system response regulator [Rhodobiaceae bacterium]|nr:PleD family two-component system response regulator [Rhodobiaceae bacterium]
MTARILVVDDIPANVKVLEARLSAEYFEVDIARNGPEALEIAQQGACDLILLDVMMPGMDGFEVCRRLKADPRTYHVPVVMVTALDQPADRVAGLEAGADDFLTKPVSDTQLMARVKSLVRLKMLTDELRLRASTSRGIGAETQLDPAALDSGANGAILLVDDRPSSAETIRSYLKHQHAVDIEAHPQEALFHAAEGNYDAVIISLELADFDPLRLCSQIRSLDRTRNLPILLIADESDTARVMRALDIGGNDFVTRPIDRNELAARMRTQIRRRRYMDSLRESVKVSVTMAMTDPMTGLYNRRYMESHLDTLLSDALSRERPLSMLILDIDFFKSVNDTHGHDVGDEVIREFARRLQRNTRGIDMTCRFGGEEFIVVMPDTDISLAIRVAERVRRSVADEPFAVQNGARFIDITTSAGVATIERLDDTRDTLIKRADQALYSAKRHGRNRVVSDAA